MPESQHVRLGLGLIVAASAIVLVSMWFLHPGAAMVRLVVVQVVAIAVAALLASALGRVPPSSPWLLSFPAVMIGSLALDSAASKTVGVAFTGFISLAFIYVGLTQHRWMSLTLLPFAAAAWYYCQEGATDVLVVRLAIGASIWIVIAELLAARTTRLEAQMGKLAADTVTDHLTGLGNRRALDDALERMQDGDVVVVLDLDHFKEVNDSLGHAAGDVLIGAFATATRSACRLGDSAFRFGGEEIVVLLSGGDGTARGAELFCERLRELWSGPGRPSFSGGVSVHGSGRAAETLRQADMALYEAKRAGRDCWRISSGPPAEQTS